MNGSGVWLLRLPEVVRRTGKGRSAIYRAIADGSFPTPVAIGDRARAWRSDEIEAWIANRLKPRERAA